MGTSYLGYPTSGEYSIPNGGRNNDFQHGFINWFPNTGAVDHPR
jgi:uncharacterized protein with LGFP repeats